MRHTRSLNAADGTDFPPLTADPGGRLAPNGQRGKLAGFVRDLRQPRATPWLLAFLATVLFLISWLDWATGPGREPASLYDLAILLAAISPGMAGSLIAASISTALYCLTLWHHQVQLGSGDLSQILLFFLLGWSAARLVEEYLRVDDLRYELLRLNASLEHRIAEAVAAERDAQSRLRDAQRLTMLGQAAAQIAHEIRNPLVSIGGFAARVQRQLGADHSAQAELSIILEETGRLERLLNDILDLGRPSGRTTDSVDLGMLLNQVLSLAQTPVQEHKLRLSVSGQAFELKVAGDEDRLKRALLNVVLNAAQAMPEGGDLTIELCPASRDGSAGAVIRVRDTGTGIEAENLARIFEPFFTTKRGGAGLGLAVVKKTIDEHGGALGIESRPREGTLVTMWLPAARSDSEHSARRTP